MAEAVTKKEKKKIDEMVKTMKQMRKQNLLGANQAETIGSLVRVLSALMGVNSYISPKDQGYVGYLSDDNVVSFAWPLNMRLFDYGFRWVVPISWRQVSRKHDLYKWAYSQVYAAVNEIFTRRLPTMNSQDFLRVVFNQVKDKGLKAHGYEFQETTFHDLPIVIIYRKVK